MRIAFTIEERARGHTRTGFGRHAYTKKESRDYIKRIASLCADLKRRKGFEVQTGALRVSLNARFSVPKAASRAKRVAMLAGDIRPTIRPDSDNLAKAIKDGMKGIVFKDDSQVVDLHVIKIYAETSGVDVIVETIGGQARDDDRAAPAEGPRDGSAQDFRFESPLVGRS